MFIKRELQTQLLDAARQYPVVTISGPRQSGKTTLARTTFPDKEYVSLEDPDIRSRAVEDPRGFLRRYPEGALFDEVQRVPELLSFIQTIVDEKKQMGMFVLTGSSQLLLMQSISQTLAGRTALLTLYPLSISELVAHNQDYALSRANLFMLRGFYPAVFDRNLEPNAAYRNYFQTYVERDVRLLANILNLTDFERFIRVLAGRVGQLVNYTSLANDVGISLPTVKSWLSLLEASHLLYRLIPFHENFGKRLVKNPKIYFTDVGLLCFLLGIENEVQLERDPLRGQIFENLCIMELIKTRVNSGRDPQLFFIRDNHGFEIDALFQQGTRLVPIEIKAGETFNAGSLKNLTQVGKLDKARFMEGTLIYGGNEAFEHHGIRVVPFISMAGTLA